MTRLYIKKIIARGAGKRPSTINFTDGVNILTGSSNTGKTYALNCIDFLFAGDIPFSKKSTGYDTITLILSTATGKKVSLTRRIISDKHSETGENIVEVRPWKRGIKSGNYAIDTLVYSDLLLSLFGIKEHHKIIATHDLYTQDLTIRTLLPFFFLDETTIFQKNSLLGTAEQGTQIAGLCALKFLMDADDLNQRVPEKTREERDRIRKRNTEELYKMFDRFDLLHPRFLELKATLASIQGEYTDDKITNITKKIDDNDAQINQVMENSRHFQKESYQLSGKLEEAHFLKERYANLRTQYQTDLKRLDFITEGAQKSSANKKPLACPFCQGELSENNVDINQYSEAMNSEKQQIQLQLNDLLLAEAETAKNIHALQDAQQQAKQQQSAEQSHLEEVLHPRSRSLKEQQRALMELELIEEEFIDMMVTAANTESIPYPKEMEAQFGMIHFDPRTKINKELWQKWSDRFTAALKDCGYPGALESCISLDIADVIIAGKRRQDAGKGKRAFLNTLMSFTLMKFLSEHGAFAPALLILDSPILSLREKTVVQDGVEGGGMVTLLLRYIIENCGENQVIIAENELPDSSVVDYNKVNVIPFTSDESFGRQGFFV